MTHEKKIKLWGLLRTLAILSLWITTNLINLPWMVVGLYVSTTFIVIGFICGFIFLDSIGKLERLVELMEDQAESRRSFKAGVRAQVYGQVVNYYPPRMSMLQVRNKQFELRVVCEAVYAQLCLIWLHDDDEQWKRKLLRGFLRATKPVQLQGFVLYQIEQNKGWLHTMPMSSLNMSLYQFAVDQVPAEQVVPLTETIH